MDELTLMPLELTALIAALVPPPRTHRHRYLGVLAPHSPLIAAVTAEMLLSASESLVCHKIPATNLLQTGQSCSGQVFTGIPGEADLLLAHVLQAGV